VTIPLLQPVLSDDMEAVDRVLREALQSDVPLIRQVGEYIIAGGGKRLRPALLLLIAQACGYRGTHHHTLAADGLTILPPSSYREVLLELSAFAVARSF
jgi:octaprenyl-diphosphate synthase